jgi:hypothetical protein
MQESNHMSHYTIMICHRHLRMNMEDGLVVMSCMFRAPIVYALKWIKYGAVPLNLGKKIRNLYCNFWENWELWLECWCRKDFANYADVCFREFGDRVKYWTTVNESNIFSIGSYDQGITPPQRCSPPFCVIESTKGNSTFEPYLVVHHVLLAHSSAVRLYRRKYRVYHLIFLYKLDF